ncbi:MAG: beta-ketoacyl-ACP synthase II [Planctomycetaceae bacterium]|nr:beta-ketoacyl-ACP synthase II [Planctomycetaceae bacterium]
MSRCRVVITGLGTVNPVAHDVPLFWARLLEGTTGIRPISRFDAAPFASRIGGQIVDWAGPPTDLVDPREARRMDPFTQYATAAAIEAVRDSGIAFDPAKARRYACIIGTGIGGLMTLQEQHEIMMARGVTRVSPLTVPKMMGNAAAGTISILYGLTGVSYATVTACASAANAVGEAMALLQRGAADVVITGGSEAALTEIGLASFCALKGLSTRNDDPAHASRPWDKDRDGFLLAEGAGVVILETLDHARARGAKIYAELVGFGATCDAYHITAPSPEGTGACDAMILALEDAAIAPDQVGYINAHGTSTELGDMAETVAIKKAFGDYARNGLMVSSTKSLTGHMLGASGGAELVACCKAMQDNVLPGTWNLDNPSEGCDLDYIPNQSRQKKVQYMLSNSFGFGGHNACLIIKRFE